MAGQKYMQLLMTTIKGVERALLSLKRQKSLEIIAVNLDFMSAEQKLFKSWNAPKDTMGKWFAESELSPLMAKISGTLLLTEIG